jgi:hypothetical protein
MALRIWYQSLFDGGRMPVYFEGLKARAREEPALQTGSVHIWFVARYSGATWFAAVMV